MLLHNQSDMVNTISTLTDVCSSEWALSVELVEADFGYFWTFFEALCNDLEFRAKEKFSGTIGQVFIHALSILQKIKTAACKFKWTHFCSIASFDLFTILIPCGRYNKKV